LDLSSALVETLMHLLQEPRAIFRQEMGSNGGGLSVVLIAGDRPPPAQDTFEPPLEETRLGVRLHVCLHVSVSQNINAQRPPPAPISMRTLPSKIRPEISSGAKTLHDCAAW
jgi:hypothetical protein